MTSKALAAFEKSEIDFEKNVQVIDCKSGIQSLAEYRNGKVEDDFVLKNLI